MDVLKPDLKWIDGRCYRVNFQHSSFREEEDGQFVDDGLGEESMLSTRLKYLHFFLFCIFSKCTCVLRMQVCGAFRGLLL